jgi:hypothetical protein
MSCSPLIPAEAGIQDRAATPDVSSLDGLGSDICDLFRPVPDPGFRRDERWVG